MVVVVVVATICQKQWSVEISAFPWRAAPFVPSTNNSRFSPDIAKTGTQQRKKKIFISTERSFQKSDSNPFNHTISAPPIRLSLSLLDISKNGCITSTYLYRLAKVGWRGTKGGSGVENGRAPRSCSVLSLRSRRCHLLLCHPWRSHSC